MIITKFCMPEKQHISRISKRWRFSLDVEKKNEKFFQVLDVEDAAATLDTNPVLIQMIY